VTQIIISFKYDLKNTKFPSSDGPIFYQQYPKSENEAIQLYSDNNTIIKVWFESTRHVYPQSSNDKNNLESVPIYGGPLLGKLIYKEISDDITNRLLDNTTGKVSEYEKFGKQVLQEIIPPISKFIDILRNIYGQFWINKFIEWDSRTQTVYDFCYKLNMKWSFDNKNWYEFIPSKNTATHLVFECNTDLQYRQFLNYHDWFSIPKIMESEIPLPLSIEFLAESHLFEDSEEIRFSYIIAVTALERAIIELIHTKMKNYLKILNKFIDENNKTKLIVISKLINIPQDDLSKSLEALDIRNTIIHDGILKDANHYEILHGLFRTISAICNLFLNVQCKLPPLNKKFQEKLRIM